MIGCVPDVGRLVPASRTVTVSSHRGQATRPSAGGGSGTGTGALQYGHGTVVGMAAPNQKKAHPLQRVGLSGL